ncbi:MAG TPA: NAD(P)H-dependent oxidoreductase [Gemmatimonadales bacterium]|nr:NAD(P)H-dependent oxidoreductase [Gemmatimonadales bacterium]
MRLLAFAASLKKTSLNRQLLRLAARLAAEGGADVEAADFADFVCPNYDADLEAAEGVPPGAVRLGRQLDQVDGILLSSPEYNSSLPGTLKNTIDWVSRLKPLPLRGKSGVLMAVSDGAFGGIRGLWQLRIPLEVLGVALMPDMYVLPMGKTAFHEDGTLVEASRQKRLEQLITAYLRFGGALAASNQPG